MTTFWHYRDLPKKITVIASDSVAIQCGDECVSAYGLPRRCAPRNDEVFAIPDFPKTTVIPWL